MKFDWKKYIYKIAVVILVIFFVGGVGIGAADILSIEGVEELYEAPEGLSELPETDAEIVDYLNSCIKKANVECPQISLSDSFSIDELGVEGDDSDAINAGIAKITDTLEDKTEELFEVKELAFFENNSEILKTLDINIGDIESTELSYEYYTCTMCGEKIGLDDYGENCPECDNEGTLRLRSNDNYTIVVTLKNGTESVKNNDFPMVDNLKNVIDSDDSNAFKLDNYKKTDAKSYIYAEVNRLTDEIKTLQFISESEIVADFSYLGTGTQAQSSSLNGKTTEKYKFSFTWPGLSLNEHTYQVEAKSTEVLKATLSCDEPTAYTVNWTSSDESIITVDEEGYIKSGKTLGSATVTASFEFGGKTYSDSCEVIVCVPAEGMDLSKGKLSLKVGESFTLEAEMDPKDTTNTLVYWFTKDDGIATVDENGTVTAVAAGNVTIYAISDDGNYYSSCEVEVNN